MTSPQFDSGVLPNTLVQIFGHEYVALYVSVEISHLPMIYRFHLGLFHPPLNSISVLA